MKNILLTFVFLPSAVLFFSNGFGADQPDDGLFLDEFENWDGKQLSKTHCVTCHLYPEPTLLPKESWPFVLDLMGLYFGFDDGKMLTSLADRATREDLFDIHKYPDERTLTPFQWAAIRDFYESSEGSGPVAPPPLGEPLTLFETSLVYGTSTLPVSSLVQVIPEVGGFYLADAEDRSLVQFDSNGKILNSEILPGSVVHLDLDQQMQRVTIIGRIMHPSNSATGSIFEREKFGTGWRMVADSLHRPVHALTLDLDGDDHREIVINEFGHYVGNLSLLSPTENESMKKTVIRHEPGSISACVLYLDESGELPHLLVLNAQAREEVTFYRNRGGLWLEPETLLQKPPSFGYTQLHLVDLTGDGTEEVVTTNGDNADLPGPPLKAYHGIRIHRLLPGPQLEEIAFLHVPGAFQATFDDFDGNGLNDIAVVSYFPDSRRPEQRFVYFENKGDLSFERKTMEAASLAPWMTIDSGDIDNDGDQDIVLGSAYIKMRPPSNASNPLGSGMIIRNNRIRR